MKTLHILFIALFASLFVLTSWTAAEYYSPKENTGDILLGDWKPSNGRSVIRISKGETSKGQDKNKYYGRIVWLKEKNNADGTPRLDINNPDDAKKSDKILGMTNMRELEFVGDKNDLKWENGNIYDPNNGSDYSFEMTMNKKNTNLVDGRGYIGVSMFGRTDTWKRLVKKGK
ncbi:hypothetical protein Fleli_2217 [Bernardetia litoralis DSM 6794]|uniref:DUF2147 domain-containing protein n=1 Tax=Bernardetia litoralis (strain ATCC 23117 / DSM 6794 / NBRC 15988 / NCIMB 1366 / Fx l1 / Sio-4) TaxID=880071 RepID=I4AKW0_BERLS|nr:DUF2147 domain-containing protein [Bernardetia litoralis]AFM04595.1 hypothetical protein Fleli_2217 [Bernardetia litoralis DSM 6794]